MHENQTIEQRLEGLRHQIAEACRRCGRSKDEITLLAASKRQPVERLLAAWNAGVRVFGENRVQEALAKMPLLPDDIDWHLIGPLQSNKAKQAVAAFGVIHSVDRLKIGLTLEREAVKQQRPLLGFLEINIGEEETKHGFLPANLRAQVRPLADLEMVRIEGLMAIPPWESDEDRARNWFRRLRELRDELFGASEWQGRKGWLSMGMSGDFPLAIEEGASHIRLGTSLLGQRAS